MVATTRERRARIHALELEHHENIHKTDAISRDEEARLLQLRLLALRDEKAALKDNISQKDARIAALGKKSDQLRVELDDSREAARAQETRIKRQHVELANLRAEVSSLNDSLQSASKVLQEKLALTRELNRLRPEMEHLQAQLASYQATVAEKNDLRRQLDSLEVELENERRSRQRVQAKEDDAAMAELKSRLDKAEKKLAADKAQQDRANKEHERELAEAQALSDRLEARVESLKAKYRDSQGIVRETRAQLERCHAELETAARTAASRGAREPAKKSVTMESGLNRKRRAREMSYEDITVQTPGNEDMASKRTAARKRGVVEHATVGEKSAFSITPFLSRTKSLDGSAKDMLEDAEPGSSPADNGAGAGRLEAVPEAGEAEEEPLPDTAVEEAAPKRKVLMRVPPKKGSKAGPRPRGRPRTKGLTEASPAQANRDMSKAEGTAATEVLAAGEEEKVSAKAACRKAPGRRGAAAAAAEGGDAKKKRRKLLGGASQPLFGGGGGGGGGDDGEAAAEAVEAKTAAGPGKQPRPLLLGGGGGGVRNAFAGASFSPLKRDRRGANASFLA